MSSLIHSIRDENLSRAWLKAFEATTLGEVRPLTVTITGFTHGEPAELAIIREELDRVLADHGKQKCQTVANTIFPKRLWNPDAPRSELYRRFARVLPRIIRMRRSNRHGTYFQRLISYGAGGVNQLEHILETWHRGNHRRSALFATVADPLLDHTHQRQRGFPCLHYISFTPEGLSGLAVTAVYATQYIFDKAYGNYLGLCRLGHFIAHEMQRDLCRVTCFAAVASRGDIGKRAAEEFSASLRVSLRSPSGRDVSRRVS